MKRKGQKAEELGRRLSWGKNAEPKLGLVCEQKLYKYIHIHNK